jgi:urea transport system substrate-binding protein
MTANTPGTASSEPSLSRKAVLPLFEERDKLLFYSVQYEGNESSKNVVYGGLVPNQQVLPTIDWLTGAGGGRKKKIFLLGSDYVFPRTLNFIAKKYLALKGLKPAGEANELLVFDEHGATPTKAKISL